MCAQHVSRVLSPPASTRFARRRALRAPEPRPHLWAHLTVTSQVEIDQINKPFLPVAAGRISPKMAWALVIGSGAFCPPSVPPVPPPPSDPARRVHVLRATGCPCNGALTVALTVARAGAAGLAVVKAVFSPLIFWLYLFGTTVGGLYSVPPFQASRATLRPPFPPPLSRVPPLPLPHGPAAAACGVRRGAQTQAAPTGGLAIPTMHALPTERAHSLYS